LPLNDAGDLPVYVDGADEITRHLHMIKGGGGALTREKIVAAAAARFVIVGSSDKLVERLSPPVPLELDCSPPAPAGSDSLFFAHDTATMPTTPTSRSKRVPVITRHLDLSGSIRVRVRRRT